MKQVQQKKSPSEINPFLWRRLHEGLFILLAAFAIFFLLSLASYHNTDPGWSNTGDMTAIQNAGGRVGALFSDIFLYAFGYIAYLFPIVFVYSGWLLFRQGQQESEGINYHLLVLRGIGFLLLLMALTGLFSLHLHASPIYLPYRAGGVMGAG
ncbi:MAG: DNA translocase FtsK 4TM domain-containing protein, partial [Gammaproteobacteria bacterium]|nr:DNA translocase FtsK 4TM domain-containing protein [Gammaproteobacteria bacterium]